MRTYNIHASETNLFNLLASVEQGESVILAKEGKPLAKITPFEEENTRLPEKKFGFMKEPALIPDDFDTMGAEEIQAMFENGK